MEEFDLRTRKGREWEIILQVQKYGGFNPWWPLENSKRVKALERLVSMGVLVRLFCSPPFNKYSVDLDRWREDE